MVEKKTKTRAPSCRCPQKHLEISIRVSKGQHRPFSYVAYNRKRLRWTICKILGFALHHNLMSPISLHEDHLRLRSNDLFGRNAVEFLRIRSDKLRATTRDNVGLKSLGAQKLEKFPHRKVNRFLIGFF